MKIRSGFVSNSSSCSYIVELGKKVNSPKDLESILNKDFWNDAILTGDWSEETDQDYDNLSKNFPFERICEFIYRLMQESDKDNGKWLIDRIIEEYSDKDLPSYPKFRSNFLKSKYGKRYYKPQLNSEYFDDRYEAEKEIWERYTRLYEEMFRAVRMQEILENPKDVAYFSFGNESDFFNEGEDKFTRSEYYFISVLRNYGLAPILFRGLDWVSEDDS